MNVAQYKGNAVNWDITPDFNYPLQYIYESNMMRKTYQSFLNRMALAMQGKPSKNLYQERMMGNISQMSDKDAQTKAKAKCQCLPEGESFALYNAVKNRANQMASGVDTYEYKVNDPYMIIDGETEDLLAAQCSQDYRLNHLERFASVFSKDLTTAGITAVKVAYDPIHDKNIIYRINPKNVIWDTKYSAIGRERFRGYNMMISWSKLKRMLSDNPDEIINLDIKAPDRSVLTSETKKDPVTKKDRTYYMVDKKATYNNRKIRTLNGLDIYVSDMNKLASAPALGGGALGDTWEFRHDLQDCYNTQYYQSLAATPEGRTNTGYIGDDVELTIIFDMERKIEYKVINKRFVVSANGASYRRYVSMPLVNPVDGTVVESMHEFDLDCPIKFATEWLDDMSKSSMLMSEAGKLLDMHDELCSLRATRKHVSEILSILRIMTNGGDATSLAETINIEGVILDDVQGDVQALQFAYDFTALDTQITYYEQEIKRTLSGYDEYDSLQALGDRASAAESGMALSAIANGLSIHQNAIMSIYADIARQCIANRVVYSSASVFPITANGNYSTLTVQEMALDAIINVKPQMALRVHEKSTAANALTLLGSLGEMLNTEGKAYLMQLATMGDLPRHMAESFILEPQESQEAIQAAQLEGQNTANIIAQNQQAYEQNPTQYEAENIMQNNSPEDIDAIIAGLSAQQSGIPQEQVSLDPSMLGGGEMEMPVGESGEVQADPLEMIQQDGAMTTNLEGVNGDLGSQMANPNSVQ